MTSEESFARLDAIRAEKYPHEERDREEWRAHTQIIPKREPRLAAGTPIGEMKWSAERMRQ